jgi:hypothetical protein
MLLYLFHVHNFVFHLVLYSFHLSLVAYGCQSSARATNIAVTRSAYK